MRPSFTAAAVKTFVAILTLAPGLLAYPQSQPNKTETSSTAVGFKTLLDKYCVTCHNEKAQMGNLALDHADLTNIPERADVWEKVERKLRAGMMPPQGMPRPSTSQLDASAEMLESTLDRAAALKPNPGPALLRRLTRTEYGNAIRDLLGLNVDVASLLPADGYSNEGFDNEANSTTVSAVLMERYLSSGRKISNLAIGDPNVTSTIQIFRPPTDLSQDSHVEGLPLGTRGGILVHYDFPADGEYLFRAKLWRNLTQQIRGIELPTQFEISLDGTRIHLAEFGGPADEAFHYNVHVLAGNEFEKRLETHFRVKAGPHDVGFAFLKKSSAVSVDLLQPLQRDGIDPLDPSGISVLSQASITGPIDPQGALDAPSRNRILTCQPPNDDSDGAACARKILTTLTRLAYRRPPSNTEINHLIALYEVGRKQGGSDEGIETALSYVLSSPRFVFRTERDPANLSPGTAFRISDYDLATRLSFFLWSSIPDNELLALAGQGKLGDRAVLAQQVNRMLKDSRSSALVTNFADEWLHLRNLRAANPNDALFPDFDDNLRQGFLRETELFVGSIIGENRNVLDLINADYTFVNERLAAHYGIPNVTGSQFRRVSVADENRRGLLGQGSILTVTSYGNRTSPVVRGKFVLTNLMGTPPPPMPANVPPLNETVDPDKPLSMRQRMEAHRANPVCANCHRLMDPIGLTLENFDATGRWRASDGGASIDPGGTLANGMKVEGPASLRRAILARPEMFVRALTESLMTYALGRRLESYDMPAVRSIVRAAANQNYTFASLVEGIVNSTPFQMKVKNAVSGPHEPSFAEVTPGPSTNSAGATAGGVH